MSTVYAEQYGRLGNNLFQRATAIGYSITHNIGLASSRFQNMGLHEKMYWIKERGHHFQILPPPTAERVILDGYWQSEKYFAHCRQQVLGAFGYQWVPIFPDTCAIHVRRGDYLKYPDKHPVVTPEYLIHAINYIIAHANTNRFLFFSDDIPWCMEFLANFHWRFSEAAFEFSEDRTEVQDLELMSSCQHQIISNSTFSWWGAWLNQNPNKVVISPSKDNWFGPGNAHLCTDDIIPDSWIQIKY